MKRYLGQVAIVGLLLVLSGGLLVGNGPAVIGGVVPGWGAESGGNGTLLIRPAKYTVAAGGNARLTAAFKPAAGAEQDVTESCAWSSDNPAVAAAGARGQISGISRGEATIRAVYRDPEGGSHEATALIAVNGKTPSFLRIEPGQAAVSAGRQPAFNARLFYENESSEDVSAACQWESSDPVVAESNGGGRFTARSPGRTTVRARYSSGEAVLTGGAELTVTAPPASGQELPAGEEPVGQPAFSSFVIGSPVFYVDGRPRGMDVTPYLYQDRTYLPQRFLAYALGLRDQEISWQPASRTAVFSAYGTTVVLTEGSVIYTVNGVVKLLEVPPRMVGQRLTCPARFVAEAFGYTVGWDGESRTVTLSRF